jgi:hypothetical protein
MQLDARRLHRLQARLDDLRGHVIRERERLAGVEREIEGLYRQVVECQQKPEKEMAEAEIRRLEDQVDRLERGRRRRVEDELREFHEREVMPRLKEQELRGGGE